ncbi:MULTISPECIES: PKD domain-containing protein [unclassified Bacteroides]|jgi:PKD repeat protein|uniref:PKD domain-containing protein n=1 Tax=unclassified Bacteroides TaxID=2646097 RepID=UPI000E88ED9A|nr:MULTISPECIES: PKD domain-containing protein [unclassified Bacteroides]RGN51261.1 PKD domain-containing protein [Bacteroides sp. OM05-12]RHR78625.1 PKD domain-containing protein [Bacteroides sp. AF16-49]
MKRYLIYLLALSCTYGTFAFGQTLEPVKSKADIQKALKQSPALSFKEKTLSPSFVLSKATDASLKADFSVKSEASAEIFWEENFDKGTDYWKLASESPSIVWENKVMEESKSFSTIDNTNITSLFIEGSYRYGDRGQATATSNAITVPANADISFYAGYSLSLNQGYCTLTLNISMDNDQWLPLWNSDDEKEPKNWVWRYIKKDLSAYAGKTVYLQWVYNGYMGEFAIDGITISTPKVIEKVEVKTGETIYLTDLSVGEPDSWLWNFPGGTPSSSTQQNPTVYYTKDGTYDISLTVSNSNGSDIITKTGFVEVTGEKPVADILPPATFRYFSTRHPMIAPLVTVQYKDNSLHYPTKRMWEFTGIGEDGTQTITSSEENPNVNYTFLHDQNVSLDVSNQHGSSSTSLDVSVEYSGLISNFQPNDTPFTFDLGDGYGSFPGTNKMKITEYAEKFSKPSRPIMVYGVNAYFTKATATELLDQIADVSVKLCKSENGLPGEVLESSSWRVFELETGGGTSIPPTTFEFSKPVSINEEFFIVISGIPEKNDGVDVRMATANFRDHGNTAYLKHKDEWKAASDFFPAGQNHTSYLVAPAIVHSVLAPISEVPLKVGKDAGVAELAFFSYCGYETPIKIDQDWCRITSKPNGLTLDTIRIAYDKLPEEQTERKAILTITDGMDEVNVELIQSKGNPSQISIKEKENLINTTSFSDEFILSIPANTKNIQVSNVAGKIVYSYKPTPLEQNIKINCSNWDTGIYLIQVGNRVLKGLKY